MVLVCSALHPSVGRRFVSNLAKTILAHDSQTMLCVRDADLCVGCQKLQCLAELLGLKCRNTARQCHLLLVQYEIPPEIRLGVSTLPNGV